MSKVSSWPTVVVGVDGSEQNRSAVSYATAEAVALGVPLRLVTALDYDGAYVDGVENLADPHLAFLDELRGRIAGEHAGLTVRAVVEHIHPLPALRRNAGPRDVLVVGKRGLGPVRRLLVGSNSIRLASRAPVPVIVVPPEWEGAGEGHPIVIGVDPHHPNANAMRFAFERAQRTDAMVVAVHGADRHPAYAGDPLLVPTVTTAADNLSIAELEQALKPISSDYPEVALRVIRERGHAAEVLLNHARDAQLLVVGRRHEGPMGWGLGHVARVVLHEAEVPVAVVPGSSDEE